jgi:hypothetical protein
VRCRKRHLLVSRERELIALVRALARLRLDRKSASDHGAGAIGGRLMVSKVGAGVVAVAAVTIIAGCGSLRSTACQCPKPVAYDEAILKQISQALRALPPDNVLHQAMEDYESERDDLRFCP